MINLIQKPDNSLNPLEYLYDLITSYQLKLIKLKICAQN